MSPFPRFKHLLLGSWVGLGPNAVVFDANRPNLSDVMNKMTRVHDMMRAGESRLLH
jgi:hypothetical protein